jgi:hypothetical protein
MSRLPQRVNEPFYLNGDGNVRASLSTPRRCVLRSSFWSHRQEYKTTHARLSHMLHVLQRLDARMERCLGIGIPKGMCSRHNRRGGPQTVKTHLFLGDGGNVSEIFFDQKGVLNVMIDFTWFQLEPYADTQYVVDEVYEEVCSKHRGAPAVLELREGYIYVSNLDFRNMECKFYFSPAGRSFYPELKITSFTQTPEERARNIQSTFTDIWSQSEEVVFKLNKKCGGWLAIELHPVMVDVRYLVDPFVDRLNKKGFVRKDDPILARERRRFVTAGKCFMYDKLFNVMQCLKALGGNVDIFYDLDTMNGGRIKTIQEVVDYVLPPSPTAPEDV